MPHQRKLKNLLINAPYQFRYIFWLTSTGLLLVALNSSLIYYYVQENYSLLIDLSPMTDEAKGQLYSELRQIILGISGVSILFLVLVSILGLIFSHRTAGALYHFKRIFEAIRSGKKDSRIHLRPKDDFHDVANAFNAMMDELTLSKDKTK